MIYDVIIIGSGPAGLASSLYTSRSRLKTLVFENPYLMSQAAYADNIENYPGFPGGISGMELLEKFKEQSKNFGTELIYQEVENIKRDKNCFKITTKEKKKFESLSLIIASGSRPRKLNIPGENELCGKGVSYCATCDAAFFKDKEAIVVGGGNAACEEALFLTNFASKVKLIHRRNRLRAVEVLQERIFSNKKIEVIWESEPIEIYGSQKVEAVKIKHKKTNKEKIIDCQGIFILIGQIPNTEFLKEILKLDKDGYIICDEELRTSLEGVFACGDCRKKMLRQVVTGCGDGAVAAMSSYHYINRLKGTEYK